MNIKARLKSYSFWVSLASAVFLLIKVLGQSLGFSVDESLYNDIFTALCGILVICGIIAPPTAKETTMLPASSNTQKIQIAASQAELIDQTNLAEAKTENIPQNPESANQTEIEQNTTFEHVQLPEGNAEATPSIADETNKPSNANLQKETEEQNFNKSIIDEKTEEEQTSFNTNNLSVKDDNFNNQKIVEIFNKTDIQSEDLLASNFKNNNSQIIIMDIPKEPKIITSTSQENENFYN